MVQEQINRNSFENVRVLYVEDEADSREKLLRVLKRRFSDIHIAIDGEEGLALYYKVLPDLIITDIKMNQLSGLQMIESIRKHNDKVQIIVTTAHDDNEFFIQSIENKVNHFILKPIDLECFLMAIQKSVYEVQLEKELKKQKDLTRAILDFQENMIFVIKNGKIVECNQAFTTFTGLEKTIPFQCCSTLSTFFIEDPNYFFPLSRMKWTDEFMEKGNASVTVRLKGLNGKMGIFIMKATAISNEKQLLFVCTDITDLVMESKKNELLATIDPLTGIYNRLKFDEILTTEMKRSERYRHTFSIIMFDIDFFKKVNDSFGHQKGDEVLATIATMVQQRIREGDIFARWGGEEFIILTPETDRNGAVHLAESIRLLIQNFIFGEAGQLTCSFGVSQFSGHKIKFDLINEADQALYQSKNNGRNCVTSF